MAGGAYPLFEFELGVEPTWWPWCDAAHAAWWVPVRAAVPLPVCIQMVGRNRFFWLCITLGTLRELAGHASVGLRPPLLQEELLAEHRGIRREMFGGVA